MISEQILWWAEQRWYWEPNSMAPLLKNKSDAFLYFIFHIVNIKNDNDWILHH